MRHSKHKYKLGVNPSHRKSLIKNLAIEVIDHGKIKTTQAKAKAVKGYVEKLVTLAKEDSVHNRRLAFKKLNNKSAVAKLFTEVAPKFKERN
jgi:large subunit ribosomal protein L17